jgi:hypothetical protein
VSRRLADHHRVEEARMQRPVIERTSFGSITIDGRRYDHDVVIRPDGTVERRRKKLSRRVYGSSHTVSLDEARHICGEGAAMVVVGTGQYGALVLSDEAAGFFRDMGCRVSAAPTPEALGIWNSTEEAAVAMFHVTC